MVVQPLHSPFNISLLVPFNVVGDLSRSATGSKIAYCRFKHHSTCEWIIFIMFLQTQKQSIHLCELDFSFHYVIV